MTNRFYLAGPMSGLPSFNFPAFYAAADHLRSKGWDIISPAELDDEETKLQAMESANGNPQDTVRTWGDFLARDVKIVADGCTGIIFLPDWFKSRGARLEAFVGCLQPGYIFYEYMGDVQPVRVITRSDVLHTLMVNTL